MNLLAVLTTGLFAGGISCAAVQGGLLTGLISRQRADAQATTVAPATAVAGRSTVYDVPVRWSTRLADDLTPVGGFLAGKLLSHTLFGALLGTLGGAVQLSLGVRTWLQIGAGLLIVTFGLAQLGAPGFRRIVIEPPAAWTRLVRKQARSQAAVAPALLGLVTVLIPCGVTLSVAALALASGSAVQGAAIMAVFVLGTGPLFAVLGYAARLAATAWRGRLGLATGLVVLAMGLYTLNGGLELAGSPLAASSITQSLTPAGPAPDAPAASVTEGTQTVTITARTGSYTPHTIAAEAGVPTTLVIKSDNASGCVRYFVIPDRNIEKILPVKGETRVDLGVLQPGRLAYTCGMGMYSGVITIA
ncbi:sulfite exporter TauE/SafE family protein [Nocardia gipuzkoensis]|uniref:sulfite exporter TauE/SafE family protein n=1 Tax=Nocardia gipuzkoensis TaxID=2749991 RepID=UPI001E2BE060|nr:sulfite exporter TauE/SafE family protein [Nocardia gipuzkoensis]UGT70905.1 sulfite exporter TauE/SafE family protein [Nocardia gipuzkoensis]